MGKVLQSEERHRGFGFIHIREFDGSDAPLQNLTQQ
jgi:hypothetical protein